MAKEVMAEGRFLRLVRGDRGWEWAERIHTQTPVGIVAVTPPTNDAPRGKLLLVEQLRIPVGKVCIEIPAGLVGDIDGAESWQDAARRELEEETGWTCDRVEFLTEGPPSAGMSSEMVKLALAHGLKKIGAGGGDGTEGITVHEVPLDEVAAWLAAKVRAGVPVDAKVYAALFFAITGA